MKRTILFLMIAFAAFSAWGQDDLSAFQDGFQAFSADMAATLSYNATVGSIWSDAYIGQFPHLGAGVALGLTAVPAASMQGLFTAMGITLPAQLEQYGLPIPAAAVAVKLGGFLLPFDLGLKAMVLPPELTAELSAAGIAADYKLFGGNIRVGLVKEGFLFPDVSLGAGYNRLTGSIDMPVDIPTQTYTFNDGSTDHMLQVTDPSLAMEWTTDSFDFTLQVSKKLLFIRPFLGAGLSIGKSTVSGGMAASMMYDNDTSTPGDEVPVTAAEVDAIKQALADAGQPVPDISADGFMFSAENGDPVFRVYGGVSLDLLILVLDLQGMYVPATQSLGANAMIRIQL